MQENRIEQYDDQPDWVRELNRADDEAPQKLWGVLADYGTPEELMEASTKVRDAGYTKWDTLTPFPVHGIDEAMGIKPTILPWIVLGMGVTGGTIGLLMQWFMNAYDYRYMISGKPFFSLPANIPVTFELTILFAAYSSFFLVFILNVLPEWFNPLFRLKRMERFTSDRFGLVVDARDPIFDRARVEGLLSETGGQGVEAVFSPAKIAALPRPVVGVGVIVATALMLPPAWITKARVSKSDKPRIHIIQDMDMQEKFKAQAPNPILEELWGEQRASLLPVPGTIARGQFVEDEIFATGMTDPNANAESPDGWLVGFPEGIEVNEELLARGENRFGIYCMPCHGATGDGLGMISTRAASVANAQANGAPATGMLWVAPANLSDPRILAQPEGQLFNTITNGLNNMQPYASQLKVEDRWAVVAYLRALQTSQTATLANVPSGERATLETELADAQAELAAQREAEAEAARLAEEAARKLEEEQANAEGGADDSEATGERR